LTSGASIHVHRVPNPWVDRLRAYRILVDGQERGKIRRGESVVLEVDPGPHDVQVRIDWCRSPVLPLGASAGEQVHLQCRPRASVLTVLWYFSFGFGRYLALTRAEPVRAQN